MITTLKAISRTRKVLTVKHCGRVKGLNLTSAFAAHPLHDIKFNAIATPLEKETLEPFLEVLMYHPGRCVCPRCLALAVVMNDVDNVGACLTDFNVSAFHYQPLFIKNHPFTTELCTMVELIGYGYDKKITTGPLPHALRRGVSRVIRSLTKHNNGCICPTCLRIRQIRYHQRDVEFPRTNLTEVQARQALSFGHRLVHRHFGDGEWVDQLSPHQYIFEDGVIDSISSFWCTRKNIGFEDVWSIVEK